MNKEELIKMRDTLNGWIKSFERDEIEEVEEVETPNGLKYKVGDLIILRDDLEDYETYGDYSYNSSMSYLRNAYSQINCINYGSGTYDIDGWYITDEMIDHDRSLYLNSFTKDEREFLSNISDKYEWIAEDVSIKDKIDIFLEINEKGTKMSDEHLNNIKKMSKHIS